MSRKQNNKRNNAMKEDEKFRIEFGKFKLEVQHPGKNSIIIIGMSLIFLLALVIFYKVL